jgi:hypothetical protein
VRRRLAETGAALLFILKLTMQRRRYRRVYDRKRKRLLNCVDSLVARWGCNLPENAAGVLLLTVLSFGFSTAGCAYGPLVQRAVYWSERGNEMDKNGFSSFLLGLGVGIGVAVLFAPKSGAETSLRFCSSPSSSGSRL